MNRNVTSRRRPIPTDDDESEKKQAGRKPRLDDEYVDTADNAQAVNRRKKLLRTLGVESEQNGGAIKAMPLKLPVPAMKKQESVIGALLSAHMDMKKQINSQNCFNTNTLLDMIDAKMVETEPIMDMAIAIDNASTVYGYRVDRAHADTLEAKLAFLGGKTITTEEADPNSITGKKQKVVIATDWQNRYQDVMYGEGPRGVDDGNEPEELAEGDPGPYQTADSQNDGAGVSSDIAVICHPDVDIDYQLHVKKSARKKTTSHIYDRNKCVEDEDSRLRILSTELSENDYYHKAISRYSEGTAASLLLRNARTSGDGRVLYLHGRNVADEFPPPPEYNKNYVSSLRSLVENSWAETPAVLENDLLPPLDLVDYQQEMGYTAEDYNQSAEDPKTDEGSETVTNETIREISDENRDPTPVIEVAKFADETVFPDVTIMQTTMIPDLTMIAHHGNKRQEEMEDMPVDRDNAHTVKCTTLRGRDLSEFFIPNGTDLGLPSPTMPTNDFKRLEKNSITLEKAATCGFSCENDELSYPQEEISAVVKHLEHCKLENELSDVDNLWASDVYHAKVLDADCENIVRKMEGTAKSHDELRTLKKRVLRPGEYIFVAEQPTYKNSDIAADPWAKQVALKEGTSSEYLSLSLHDDYSDEEGPGLGNLDLNEREDTAPEVDFDIDDYGVGNDDDDVPVNKEDNVVDKRIVEELNRPDVPDVPVADTDGDIAAAAVASVRMLGKQDDAHWKGLEPKTKKEKKKKPPKKEERKKIKAADQALVDNFLADLDDTQELKYVQDHFAAATDYDLLQLRRTKAVIKRRPNSYKLPASIIDSITKIKEGGLESGPTVDPRFAEIEGRMPKTEEEHFIDHHVNIMMAFSSLPTSVFKCLSDRRHTEKLVEFDRYISLDIESSIRLCSIGLKGFLAGVQTGDDDEGFDAYDIFEDGFPLLENGAGGIDMLDEDFGEPAADNEDAGSVRSEAKTDIASNMEDDSEQDVGNDFFDDDVTITESKNEEIEPPKPKKAKTKHEELLMELHEVQMEENNQEARGEIVRVLNKKIAIRSCNVDQSKVKSYFKEILTNPMMDEQSLKAVVHWAELETTRRSLGNETILAGGGGEANTSAFCGDVDESILPGPSTSMIQAAGPSTTFYGELDSSLPEVLEVSRIVTAAPMEIVEHDPSPADPEGEISNSVLVSDFNVQGLHTMTSLMACLPYRAVRPNEKQMHVAFAFSIALQMCNENGLNLQQNKDESSATGKNETWMKNLIVRNEERTQQPNHSQAHQSQVKLLVEPKVELTTNSSVIPRVKRCNTTVRLDSIPEQPSFSESQLEHRDIKLEPNTNTGNLNY